MLPEWPPGTVAVLATGGGEEPHAIPVSALHRVDATKVLIALAEVRESLARLRRDPQVALVVIAERDVVITAYGRAEVLDQCLVEGVSAVRLDVTRVQDHGRPTFSIERGVGWRWTDPGAQERDAAVRAALESLAGRIRGPRR